MADGSSADDAARQLARAAGNSNANYLTTEVEDDYEELNNTISGVFDVGVGMPSTSRGRRRTTAATPKTRRGRQRGGANATAAASAPAPTDVDSQPGPSGRGRGRGGGRKRGRGGGGRKAAAASVESTPDQAAGSCSQPTATTTSGKWKVENVPKDEDSPDINNVQESVEIGAARDSGTVNVDDPHLQTEHQEILDKDPEEEKPGSANSSQPLVKQQVHQPHCHPVACHGSSSLQKLL